MTRTKEKVCVVCFVALVALATHPCSPPPPHSSVAFARPEEHYDE